MADEETEIEEEEAEGEEGGGGKSKMGLIGIVVVLLAVFAGGGYFAAPYIQDMISRAEAEAETVEEAEPAKVLIDPFEALSDRDFDIWEPLLQIAAKAGGRWPKEARAAALAFCAPDALQAIPLRIQVLGDLGELWEGSEPFMLTADILDRLHEMKERPW